MKVSLPLSLVICGGAFGLAQSPVQGDPGKRALLMELPSVRPGNFTLLSVPNGGSGSGLPLNGIESARPRATSGWTKHLTVESFGFSSKPQGPGFEPLPNYQSPTLFDLHGLECPGCVMPAFRSRSIIPPFGANAKLRLLDGRFELVAGFGAVESLRPEGTFQPQGLQRHGSAESAFTGFASGGDAWLAQAKAGAAVAVDPHRRIWVGGTARYINNLGPGQDQWSTLSGNATFNLGR